jgi:hypothetical protein
VVGISFSKFRVAFDLLHCAVLCPFSFRLFYVRRTTLLVCMSGMICK